MTAAVDDWTVIVSGQAGDGSLTLVSLLSDLFASRGLHLYQSREVASRIRGGTAAACLRASAVARGGLGDRVDLLVAFDSQGVEQAAPLLSENSFVIYDDSDGPIRSDLLPEHTTTIEVPFGRLAVSELRRDLYKNGIAFGVATRLVGAADDEAEAALRRSLRRLPGSLIESNVQALHHGFEYADAAGIAAGGAPWTLAECDGDGRLLISGNEAVALGFLVAGGRFFAGYPITPASEILEFLSARLPEFGGVAVQAEDELGALNMALGAALTGTRAMTASSGPGIALMQEGVGHLGSAEIGVVIVDCQRAGPSTGMPTKPEQSDVAMVISGGSGDFERVVLAPADPRDAFELTVTAANLAERYQGPVYLLLDQAVGQDSRTVPRFDIGAVRIDRGKLLHEAAVAELDHYRRYEITDDGISPWAPFGTPGAQHLVTGNERNEWGLVSASAANRSKMVEKRARKLDAIRPELPRGRCWGEPAAEIGLLGFGMEAGVIEEAVERFTAGGLAVRVLQPLTLWPVLEDVTDFVSACLRVYVVEHNATGQYAHALAAAGVPAERLRSVLRYDGVPFRPGELTARILAAEGER